MEWKRKKRSGIFENYKAYLDDFGKRRFRRFWNEKGRREMEFLRIVRHLKDFGKWNGKGRGVEFLRIVRHIWTILESGMGKEEEE